ncbi:MAG: C1 family peptidase [Rudaea sp.]
MAKQKLSLGWQRDLPDHRDFLYSAPLSKLKAMPPKVDLRKGCPPVYNQGDLGSCTANAIAGAVQFDRRKSRQKPDFVPSRLFIYYNERVIEHSVNYDAGAQLRDGIKAVAKQGVCPEKEWPYVNIAPPNENAPFPANAPAGKKPPTQCYSDAKKYTAASYQRVLQNLAQMKGCIAEGYPFVFGFTVYEKWYANPTTTLPLPGANESVVGGHAVLAVGYDDTTQCFTFRNSWGAKVGAKGYFYMPYAYLANASLANDLWTIRGMSA